MNHVQHKVAEPTQFENLPLSQHSSIMTSSSTLTQDELDDDFHTGAEDLLLALEEDSSDDGGSPPPMTSLMMSPHTPTVADADADAGHQASIPFERTKTSPSTDRVSAHTRSSTRALMSSNTFESSRHRSTFHIGSGAHTSSSDTSAREHRNGASPSYRTEVDGDLEYDADGEQERQLQHRDSFELKRPLDNDRRSFPLPIKRHRSVSNESDLERHRSLNAVSPIQTRSRTTHDHDSEPRRTLTEVRTNGALPQLRNQHVETNDEPAIASKSPAPTSPLKLPDSPSTPVIRTSPRRAPSPLPRSSSNTLLRPHTETTGDVAPPPVETNSSPREEKTETHKDEMAFKKPAQVSTKILEERRRRRHQQEQKENKDRFSENNGHVAASEDHGMAVRPLGPIKENDIANGIRYTIINEIGYGGSSRVYKVISQKYNEVFALKRVSLANVDPHHVQAFMNEIRLLQMLKKHDRIIQMYDYEVNRELNYIYLVMELGEIDLAHLLFKQRKRPLNLNFIRMYWEQMLEAVHTIHTKKVVHTDLKPANFMLVGGSIKLIDFGIAKKIANDTTNIQRDHQLGTIGYMSPEALDGGQSLGGPNGKSPVKLARSSDVWSLGCILYEMVYGRTPFHDMSMWQKIKCIPDPSVEIPFPAEAVFRSDKNHSSGGVSDTAAVRVSVEDDLLDTLQSCLQRDPKKRKTIPELLQHPFLKPRSSLSRADLERDLNDLVRAAYDAGSRSTPMSEDKEIQRLMKALADTLSCTPKAKGRS